jgi:ADP-dependent NAD(P)H-hydrate dehydratase / NAD(P)H-hydrate epimerase
MTLPAGWMKVVTSEQMRVLERSAVEHGATWAGLMEQAGRGMAEYVAALLGEVRGRRVAVLVGPGNNGGDGLVIARQLHDMGAAVSLYLWRRREDPADTNWRLCRERQIPELRAEDDQERAALRGLLGNADLVVDALLGIGVSRPLVGDIAEIVSALNALRVSLQRPYALSGSASLVLSVDVPSGVNADTGAVMGVAVQADVTIVAGLVKRGLLFFPGMTNAGLLECVALDLVPADVEAIMTEAIGTELARSLLPARPDDAHKGTFGKVLVVGGSAQYPGAPVLAAAAAARAGAGLVTIGVGRSGAAASGRPAEITLRLLPEAEWGVLGEAAADEVLKAVEGYRALVVGPGIGREKATSEFLTRLLGLEAPRQRGQIGFRIGTSAEKPATKERPALPPIVLDADGLTLLAEIDGWWEHLPRTSLVLTPHPEEMRRLLGAQEIPADPANAAAEAAGRWGQIVVLKGATTVIAEPEGRVRLNAGGNAALATAGTGDVLAGTIAGLLAQGLAPFDAGTLGVFLHSAAGRLVRDELGDMGTIASDLLPRLPLAIKGLRSR